MLIRTIDRYTTLSKALMHANTTDSARTAQAGLVGRQPKKRIDMNDIHPLFTIDRYKRKART